MDILSPEIVENIIQFLCPKDLKNLCLVSQRYLDIVFNYFRVYPPNEIYSIVNGRVLPLLRSCKEDFYPRKDFGAYFLSFIQHIRMDGNLSSFQFVRRRCGIEIKTLVLHANHEFINDFNMEIIDKNIKNVISLKLKYIRCEFSFDRFQCILKFLTHSYGMLLL